MCKIKPYAALVIFQMQNSQLNTISAEFKNIAHQLYIPYVSNSSKEIYFTDMCAILLSKNILLPTGYCVHYGSKEVHVVVLPVCNVVHSTMNWCTDATLPIGDYMQ